MRGIIAARGMALASAYKIQERKLQVERYEVADRKAEWQRSCDALATCRKQLEGLIESSGSEAADILDFQVLLMEDPAFLSGLEYHICGQGSNAEYAVRHVAEDYASQLEGMIDNPYLQERAKDVRDVAERLIHILMGIRDGWDEPEAPYIMVAADLSPSQITAADPSRLKGIVLERGGISSHVVIIAKSLGIPCLIKTAGILDAIETGEFLLLDAEHGEAVPQPDAQQIESYKAYHTAWQQEQELLAAYRDRETCTCDGFHMRVYANIASEQDVPGVIEQGGEGVGLLRTELLYMENSSAPPSEEEQYAVYAAAAEGLKGRSLIIRTLDVGGDKNIDYLGIEEEDNPFLGFRAIRYCLKHPELFKTQLRAILRAGTCGDVQVMFPMVTGLAEIRAAKALLAEAKQELAAEGVPFQENLPVGIMIETPAAAVSARRLAEEVNFFSIGTNDLTQYLFAADRTNARVASLNSYFHPTLLSTVRYVAQCAQEAGIEVDICGQAGELPELVPLWVGMGINNLSVSIPAITRVRRQICQANRAKCADWLEHVLKKNTAEEVQELLQSAEQDSWKGGEAYDRKAT